MTPAAYDRMLAQLPFMTSLESLPASAGKGETQLSLDRTQQGRDFDSARRSQGHAMLAASDDLHVVSSVFCTCSCLQPPTLTRQVCKTLYIVT